MTYAEQHPPKIASSGPLELGHNAGQAGKCLLYGADTAGALSLSVSTLQPGSLAPLHVHSREDETFFVISGTLEAQVGEARHTLAAGDAVFLPRGLPHRLRNVGEQAAQVIMLIHPPGLESFFDEIDRRTAEGPPDPAVMREAAARCGVTILEPA